jgi:flagellar biosynthesis protein FliR
VTITLGGASLIAYLLASLRITAWLVLTPPFNTRAVPNMVKVVLGLGLAFAIAPTLAGGRLPTNTPELLLVAGAQVLIGSAMGFVTQLLISAVSTAGALLDTFGGFQLAAAFDPLGMNMNSVFGRFYQLIATTLLMATGAHLIVIGGLLETFHYLPLMALPDVSTWSHVFTTAFGLFFSIAVQIALPLVAVLFVADLGLALLTKVAPSFSAINVMYPAKIGLTLLLVGLSFPAIPHAMDRLTDLVNQAVGVLGGAS